MDFFENLPPAVTLVLGMLLLLWLVLFLLVPFMIESIRGWSRRSCQELEAMNRKLDVLTALLADRGDVRRDGTRAEPRIEPLADFGPEAGGRRAPRPGDERRAEPGEGRGVRHRPDRARKEPTI